MSGRKEISVEERQRIVDMWKEGKSYRQIAKKIGRQYSSVNVVITNFKNTGKFTSKKRSGRPCILTEKEKLFLFQCIDEEPHLSTPQLALKVGEKFKKEISANTIKRILCKANYRKGLCDNNKSEQLDDNSSSNNMPSTDEITH